MPSLADIRQDFTYGVRMLAKTPGFTAVAVLSLALGIGANTAIFTLIDTVILKLLPVKNPQELVVLTDPASSGVGIGTAHGERELLSTREYEGLRDRTQSFTGMFASKSGLNRSNANINGGANEEVQARLVSGSYFSVLGAEPLIGRTFTADEEHGPGTAPVAVLSYDYWQRRFGGLSSALNARIRIGKANLSVVGVMQSRFRGEQVGSVPDVWIPLDMQPAVMPGRMWLQDDPTRIAEKVTWLQVIGRLKPGVTLERAQADVDVVFKQIVAEEFAQIVQSEPHILNQSLKLREAKTGLSTVRDSFSDPLYVLMFFVALVLLIACANVANLLLARATARQKELSVRLSLGATRARIIRQFLTESVTLSAAGGLLGVLFALAGVRLLVGMVQTNGNDLMLDLHPDWRVLSFTLGICLLTGITFGLAPAWRASRVNVAGSLKEAGRGTTAGGSRVGLGKLLVIGQIALSAMLLIGAGWFIRTLQNLQHVELGYSREKLVLMGVDLLSAGISGERLPIAYEDVRDRLAQIPGVRAVSYSQNGIFSGSDSGDQITVEGYKPQKQGDDHARFDEAGPGYFKAMGIPMLLGRDIGPQDTAASESICVVNEAFAKFYFGSENPIGKHVTDEFPDTRKTFVIVGVAKDSRDHNLRREIPRRFYLAARQPLGDYSPVITFEIRTHGDAGGVMQATRRAIGNYNPDITIGKVKTLEETLENTLRQERMIAQLSLAFGGLALLLACIGLYGVLSYAVAQRTNELGIRMALGAQRSRVTGMILRETAMLVVTGLVIGVPASLACARFVESKLFGLKAADPMTLTIALAVMALVGAVAGYIPAFRAARVDPMVALRYE